MKFKVDCKSLLLQKALENFLEEYLDENGILISDYDGDILIGRDIKKPFSKSQLLLQLERIMTKTKHHHSDDLEINMDLFDGVVESFEGDFDEKLDLLIDEFSNKLKKLIKEEYGKK